MAWTVAVYASNVLFLAPSALLLALYRPLWLIVCHATVSMGSLCVLYGVYGSESVSLWNWVSLFNFVWILLSPWMADCLVDRGCVSFHNRSRLLYGSHGHLMQNGMLKSAWGEVFEEREAEHEELEHML